MSGWAAVAVLGGLVGLDTTSFPQMMISRPLVAGTLTGAVLGDPMAGLAVGFIMEAFALLVLPIGAARYPESGTATVAAVAAYLTVAGTPLVPGALALAVGFGVAWEWAAGESVVLLRRQNGRLLLRTAGMPARRLERLHLTAMALDFARGAVVAAGGGLLAAALLQLAAPLWGLDGGSTMALLALVTATMIGTAVPVFGGLRARRLALALGIGVGVALAIAVP
ncbi:MAG: PTS sugar transporter subunit IIC [Candidatus Longimicrobiales bacterium M2_2A_002]